MPKPTARDKAAADRAEARARGEPVTYAKPKTLDPELAREAGEASPPVVLPIEEDKPLALPWDHPDHPKGVEYHPSGRPVVRYGPPPAYPAGEDEEQLCAMVIQWGALGYSFHAIALKIGYPPTTLRQWAAQPYGAKLSHAIAMAEEYARGALELEARDNVTNGKYNTSLFGKLMASRFHEYRSIGNTLPGDADATIREGMTDFEFDRRLLSAIDRIKAQRTAAETSAAALPAPDDQSSSDE